MDSVLVVGAGPTGLVLAGELAMRGVPVEVVEQQPAPSGQSRGGGVNARTSEVLAMRGLYDAMRARSLSREGSVGHFAGLPVELDHRPWRSRHPGMMIPQDRMEAVFEEHLAGLGVRVRRSTTVAGIDTDAAGARVTADGPDGPVELTARWLVACDGGHSTVRSLTGTPFPGRPGTMSAVSADVELTAVSETVPQKVQHLSAHTRSGGDAWMMTHPLGDGVYRIVFSSPEQHRRDRRSPVGDDEIARALTAVHGPGTVLGRVLWATRFSDATRQVEHYRAGPVLFAGDAAHIHPPPGGQGLNLGVQDAMNLGWKLAAVCAGTAPDGLIDSYHDERHPVGARVIQTARAQMVIMTPPDDAAEVRALREIVLDMARLPDGNRYLTGRMSGLDLHYDLGSDHPLVGGRMPDLDLVIDAGPTTVFELLRTGNGLLLDLGAGSAPVAVPAGVDQVAAQVTGAGVDAERVLVRPDGYVAWCGAASDDPAPALARWFAVPVSS